MNEFLFIAVQFPASYLATGIWYTRILPLMPDWVQEYRKYDVVRAVDYLTKDSFYYISTWIVYVAFLLYYALVKPSDTFPLWFSFMSWVNILCMEIALQVSGKRKLNFRNSAYWTGSNLTSFLLQSLREGSVCFGLPALICIGVLERDDASIRLFAIAAGTIDSIGLIHLLWNVKKRQKRDFGSTDVTGRRNIVDTIAYRFAELYVIYYVYQLHPTSFWEMKEFIVLVTIYRSIQLALFFSVGTYFGQTWIDCGPRAPCKDTYALNVIGIAFRTFESTLSGYPKTIALTILFMKWLEKIKP